MTVFLMIVALILLFSAGTGIFVTYTNFAYGSLDFIQGNLTHWPIAVIAIAIIVFLTFLHGAER